MGKHQHKPSGQLSWRADLGREFCHFLAGLTIMVMINLAPSAAQGKVVRFTDSKGVIHITSAAQEQEGKSRKTGDKEDEPGGARPARTPGPAPGGARPTLPTGPPQAEPPPGPERKGPPPDLGAVGQPGAGAQASQAQPRANRDSLELPQGTMSKSVPYTVEGDPFLNPSLPIRPVAAGEPPGVKPVVKASRGVAAPEGGIIAFKDRHGVLHISNQGASPESDGRQWAAADPRPAAPMAAALALAIRPIAWQPDAAGGPALRDAARGTGSISSGEPVIHRFRDRRGVIHIANSPAQGSGQILASMVYLKKSFGPIIAEATQTYRLPPSLVLAVIQAESNFVPHAVSPKGALGLMQLMPGTANLLGVQDPFNPRENILAGCRYLRDLLDRFKGSLPLAVAAYNAGDSRVIAAGYSIPAIKETRNFVYSVLELYYQMEKGRW